MSQKFLERGAGGIVLCLIMILLVTIYWVNQNNKLHGYHVTAYFGDIGMLQEGDSVELGGIEVGHVVSLGIDPVAYSAQTILWIQEDVRLPAETLFSIRTRSLAGGNYVKISPGNEARLLPPRSVITKTDSVIDMTALLKDVLRLAVSGGSAGDN